MRRSIRTRAIDGYWRAWWAIYDARDRLLVRLLSQKMSRTPVLYVHPNPRSAPRAVVKLLDERGREIAAGAYDHDHVEGGR